ncbi:peroxiredoxin [Sphingomonas metalli]|uniref:thioredoxin-dependent peroxiredoxin n=1 Tax=Sphingomonas metalli TaxID=1779358 RepID=A0A916SXC8_9SPHN|nr:peroxiredoxin [Sphingomonas metalli]GGB18047.1 peroxiredoxin [Sphingomonas metalli]
MDTGDAIPAVGVTALDGSEIDLATLGGPLVVYFYPKDDTSGCTREAQDFTALAGDFAAAGVRVIGISRDTVASHARFTAKYDLAVELVSDPDAKAAEAFGVWGERKLYGRTYMGVERATFLFGRDGRLVQAWRKVRVPGHADAVLAAARAL